VAVSVNKIMAEELIHCVSKRDSDIIDSNFGKD